MQRAYYKKNFRPILKPHLSTFWCGKLDIKRHAHCNIKFLFQTRSSFFFLLFITVCRTSVTVNKEPKYWNKFSIVIFLNIESNKNINLFRHMGGALSFSHIYALRSRMYLSMLYKLLRNLWHTSFGIYIMIRVFSLRNFVLVFLFSIAKAGAQFCDFYFSFIRGWQRK